MTRAGGWTVVDIPGPPPGMSGGTVQLDVHWTVAWTALDI